ncbi:MAG: HAMP domain-containing protein [Rubrivivax sp.]|nr:MAG: HAMP domain-containing protein [Rubrivivax sp.]
MRISIATRLSLGFLPALFALLITGALFYNRLNDVEEDSRWVVHTLEVLRQLDNTRATLAEAKSSASAYQLTLDTAHMRGFDQSVALSEQSVVNLRSLTRDNTEQQRRLAELVPRLQQRFNHLRAAMAQARLNHARTQQGVELDASAQLDPVGHNVVVPLIDSMQQSERALLDQRRDQQATTLRRSVQAVVAVTLLSVVLIVLFAGATVHRITRPLLRLESGARRVGDGDYSHRLENHSDDEIGRVAAVFNQMVEQIQVREATVADQTWIKSSLASFTPIFQGGQNLQGVCHATLTQLATLLQAPCLVLYLRQDMNGTLRLTRCAAYAAAQAPLTVASGEGLAGQCLVEGRPLVLDELPPDYLRIESSLGSAAPRQVYVAPIFFESQVRAVLEIALLRPFTEIEREFLSSLAEGLGLMLNAFEAKQATEEALRTQTELSDTLERQRQALQHGNEELALQTEQLRASEKLAREQQEELRLANEEQQQANVELRKLTHTLDVRAQQLAETSAFKSEFLANMSHELRTPLNSLLILSKLLSEDAEHPLTTKQQQYARTIHESGNDLLQQINEILDMARIESGKVHIDTHPVPFAELVRLAESAFRAVAQTRHVSFTIELDPALGAHVRTDQGRVWQILKNLLANAFKFTANGGVLLSIVPSASHPASIDFTVKDSGIGIPKDKQAQIFEAFQQGDSGIARQYGGTGLGLSISLKLAHLLGGELQVESEPGQGSAFTLTLPVAGPPGDLGGGPDAPRDVGASPCGRRPRQCHHRGRQ